VLYRTTERFLQQFQISLHHRAHVPDANIVACGEQILHGMAHLAITQNQYALFHVGTSFGETDISLKTQCTRTGFMSRTLFVALLSGSAC
jgi:gamma-glutamyltranspeptidase